MCSTFVRPMTARSVIHSLAAGAEAIHYCALFPEH
jgi:hypothetical protein